jgi:hypothetical protein
MNRYIKNFGTWVNINESTEPSQPAPQTDLVQLATSAPVGQTSCSAPEKLPLKIGIPEPVEDDAVVFNRIKSDAAKGLASAKKWFIEHYLKPETWKKFKGGRTVGVQIGNWIKTYPFLKILINPKHVPLNSTLQRAYGWNYRSMTGPNDTSHHAIWLNWSTLSNNPTPISHMQTTIMHELGHAIECELNLTYGEIPAIKVDSVSQQVSQTDATDTAKKYVASTVENFTRMQRLRRTLGIGPDSKLEEISLYLKAGLAGGTLNFKHGHQAKSVQNNKFIKVIPSTTDFERAVSVNTLTALWSFLALDDRNGNNISDLSALLANFSYYSAKDHCVWIDLTRLSSLNQQTAMNSLKLDPSQMGSLPANKIAIPNIGPESQTNIASQTA